jgi:4-hydroxy-tetrahydrodipicolinate reductase
MIHILQIGFGPLGIQTAHFIAQKKEVKTVAVVDIGVHLQGKSINEISDGLNNDVLIYGSVSEAMNSLDAKPDVAIITTVSSLERLVPQVEEVARFGIPVISTCEELSYPWDLQPELSAKLDNICKEQNASRMPPLVDYRFSKK